MTAPTPIHPIPTCLHPSRVIRIIPEHPMPLPNPLAPSRANLCLSNALPNTPTPLRLVDTFPTRRSFDLSLSSRQVDSRHSHSFPTQRHSTFTLLRQVYSRRLIGLTTAVGRSPITYLPRLMRLSLSFLALYISVSLLSAVRFLCLIIRYPPFISLSHPQFPVSVHPRFIYLYSILPSTLLRYPVLSLRLIPDRSDQPDHYHTSHLYKYPK